MNLASECYKQGKHDDVVKSYKAVLQIPEYQNLNISGVLGALGVLKANQGDFVAAKFYHKAALGL